MSATILYVQACKFMLVTDEQSTAMWDELFVDLLPKLRQSLSCRVCRGLLVDPFGSLCCEHYVCRGCLKKKRSLNPGCRWCQNLEKLVEDKQIRIVLACYKKLCEYVAKSSAVRNMQVQNGEYNKTLAILQEAITSPIDLIVTDKNHLEQITEERMSIPASNVKDNKTAAVSRDKTPALISDGLKKPLSKRKVIQLLSEPTNRGEQSKKKKKKHFKGTIYSYKKKRGITKLSNSKEQDETGSGKELESETAEFKRQETTNSSSDKNIAEDTAKEVNDSKIVEIGNDSCLASETEDLNEKEKTVPKPLRSRKQNILGKTAKTIFCRCGSSCKSGIPKCIGSRCPCARNGLSCVDCPCKSCANPLNNNNNKGKVFMTV